MSMFVGKMCVLCMVLQFDQVQVIVNKICEKNGYWVVQIGMGFKDGRNVIQFQFGYYEVKGVVFKWEFFEFKVCDEFGLFFVGV